ncbi:MAG: lysylphosphatidylglycerol synthase transmembrane domain-containing protein [Myxococcota bacterium]|nr:lysylphosphatidylglycerol synthase transmembrane domain-containing protein [Myxococcota bacterium]
MSASPEPSPSAEPAPQRAARPRWRDPRIWIGLAITAVTLGIAARGVSFPDLARDLARADLVLVFGVSVPVYVLMVWFRALRWRYLTDALCPLPRGPLFRATAVGFLANNVFPLRIGEVVRAWYLSRESGAGFAPVLGTILVERVIDATAVVAMALVVFGARTGGGGAALSVGLPLLLALSLPLGLVAMLRLAPDRLIGLLTAAAAPFLPERVVRALAAILGRIAEGVGSLQGGRHLAWVVFYSAAIWLVLGILPFVAAIVGLGIDLGSWVRTLSASYVVLIAVGIAVAVPSAPGFFGPYHLAAREAMSRFGVSEESALALGTLAHVAFWLTTTGLGLVVLRARHTRLGELGHAPDETGKAPAADRR